MWSAERVVQELRASGELWETAPGLIGLRGDALELLRAIERLMERIAREKATDEWCMPAGIPLEALARADYFASFPQWLTAASHLSERPEALQAVARSAEPAHAARSALAPASAALPPAVCYHAYAALADRAVNSPTLLTAQATCWRHEGEELRPLERGWAFTMREVVCLGHPHTVAAFREWGVAEALGLAESLGLRPRVEGATDPFFAPAARGRELLQRLKALKHEVLVPIGGGRELAIASANDHETFFGLSFGIRLTDGAPASSSCVAFGLERWLLAFLVEHGTRATGWPSVVTLAEQEV